MSPPRQVEPQGECTKRNIRQQTKVTVTFPAADVTDEMLRECAVLFAGHYGVWCDGAKRASGTRVTLSIARLRSVYLKDGDSFLTTQRLNGVLVGQAFFRRFTATTIEGDSQTSGIWVTQLVVDALFRGRRIARTLLRNCFGPSDVWGGLLSSHPYAVRAFEAASDSVCDPTLVLRIGLTVLEAAAIDYAANALATGFQRNQCVMDTQFFVNHSDITRLLEGNTLGDWTLGNDLRDGEEFICVVRRRADAMRGGSELLEN
jgi:hypothetical protein